VAEIHTILASLRIGPVTETAPKSRHVCTSMHIGDKALPRLCGAKCQQPGGQMEGKNGE